MSREPKTFDKAAFGYKTEEVDRYVAELHRQIAALEADKAEQQAKMKILADKGCAPGGPADEKRN